MRKMKFVAATTVAILLMAGSLHGQTTWCEEPEIPRLEPVCPNIDPPLPRPVDELRQRLEKYITVEAKHRLSGLASYYSTSLDGTLTATGERFRNRKMTAAHLTLPLGTWVQVTSRATGRTIRVLVNDRGPYVKKFCLDLSQAAARALGVDRAEDRHVEIKIVALPGEKPLPEDFPLDLPSGDQTAEAR